MDAARNFTMLEDGFCDVDFFSDQRLEEEIFRKASA